MKVQVRIPRVFHGPRNERLLNIWEAIAEYCREGIVFQWLENPHGRLQHADMWNLAWTRERCQEGNFLLLTESDFLPDLSWGTQRWTGLRAIEGFDAVACRYQTRDPVTKVLRPTEHVGGWFVLLRKSSCPIEIDFRGRPDPCNQLADTLNVNVLRGEDCWPLHYGIRYPGYGTHLFWSRHLDDHPDQVVAGFRTRDIQLRHDAAVGAWIAAQPDAFRTLLRRRFGKEIENAPSS